ncbi:MAG: type II toxin-antitoxin system HicA family toxin [Peptococcaceae bacterium]|nr:type II toxin-antitoxin system HicA family toxin [Peptococcaceae bacterium]
MKIPRDLSGEELVRKLAKYGYRVTRQTGSHIRLTTTAYGEHHITIPSHNPLKVGVLNSVLSDVAVHMKIPKDTLIMDLFAK